VEVSTGVRYLCGLYR